MNSTALTQTRVASAKPAAKPYEMRDGGARGVSGLLLRVQPSGTKTYYFEFGRGKRLRIGSQHITLSRARTLAGKYRAEADEGRDPRKTSIPITLGDFLKDVYERHFKTHHRSDASLGNLAAWKPMHGKKLTEITIERIKKERDRRLRAGKSPATVNRNVGALKTVLEHAVSEGYLDSNPLDGLSALKVENPNRVRYLSCAEEKSLRDALNKREQRIRDERASGNAWRTERGYPLLPDLSNTPYVDHIKPMVLLTLNTGLRRGELFKLRWQDIVDDSLHVRSSTAKSRQGRHIPLNREACAVLEGWRATGTEYWVFESDDGKPFDNVKKAWRAVMASAGIRDFRWHDLRHDFASKLVMEGISLNTVRDLLGHTDINMTLRYAHLAPGHLREAVEALGR